MDILNSIGVNTDFKEGVINMGQSQFMQRMVKLMKAEKKDPFKSGESFVSSHRQEVNTFSDKLPDLELCHTMEKTKSFSNAKSRSAMASPSEKGSSPL